MKFQYNYNKPDFTKTLIQKNRLDKRGFSDWVFLPGMLFKSPDKWWGDRGKREKPHEGLDLCLFRDNQDKIVRLDGKIMIPAIYDSIVVRIIKDFIGKSIFLENSIPDTDSVKF